ncbi:isochorismatase hydrolase-3 [Coleophoma crateriformis]|uniref:Isochorismatase hydrolase-3 n=1 Tax=Coleophoma crateriformis TaxID=565419 RepID=A0A3D8RUY7_9HELO|nr:isochorismatase hydrolase-3 [Coleophoma crateriformis]
MSLTEQSNGPARGFGRRYAVLNLDLMSVLIDGIKESPIGQRFTSNCTRWDDAVHKKDYRPLTIFTTLYFSNTAQLKLTKSGPFTKLLEPFGTLEKSSPGVQIASNFSVDEKDIVIQKTRWYAGPGNSLEQILRAQNIDTVILSGSSLSGVIMSNLTR